MRTTPAEWEPHRCTIVAWPTRDAVWGPVRGLAEDEYSALINTIAEDEPVLVVCREADVSTARRLCGARNISVIAHPIDDGWIRDNGPFVVRDDAVTPMVAVAYGFNSWGNRYTPTVGDLTVRRALASRLGLCYEDATGLAVLEGGAVSSNGAGTFLISAECALTPSRNPNMQPAQMESTVHSRLGANKVVWIPHGLLEDLPNTDGHVDNVAVFVDIDAVLVQTVPRANTNHDRLRANVEVVRSTSLADGSELRVIECDLLPYGRLPDGQEQAAPYINFALTNGSVILPSVGQERMDADAAKLFGTIFPERAIKFTPSIALAYGGGGPHCVTMHVFAG